MTTSVASTPDETVWTVEAWRGAAAWLVVIAHAQSLLPEPVPMLRFTFTGVDLFFVLSGFVFAPYFFSRPLNAAPFAIRRLFRIFPAYLVALAIYVAIKAFSGQELRHVWEHLLFLHLQSREMAFYYNPAFWSLPPEVEFYVALPFLVVLARKGNRHVAILLFLALLSRVALGHLSDPASANHAFIWMHHLPGMLVEFLFGAVAWRCALRLKGAVPRLLVLGAGASAWLFLAMTYAKLGDAGINAGHARGQMGWLAALSFAFMVAATAKPPRYAPPQVIWLALWAGRLSYGVYLLHVAVLWMVEPHARTLGGPSAVFATFALTLVGSWMLYTMWEDPWRRFGRQLATRVSIRHLALKNDDFSQ